MLQLSLSNLADPTDLLDLQVFHTLKLHAQEASLNFTTAVSITALTSYLVSRNPMTQRMVKQML